MSKITSASALANNEVAYIAWDTDGKIPGCLGFEVTRVYLNSDGSEERVKCAAWVAFKGQRNPDWLPQDTGVWPIQKFSWRDLTLRKRRNGMKRRPDEVTVRYEIRPVGDLKPGMPAVPSNGLEVGLVNKRDRKDRIIRDANGKPVKVPGKAYQGKHRPLGYLAPAFVTNPVVVTSRRPPFRSTFTNGILAAQWLSNVLDEDGIIEKNELIEKISDPDDPHRKYLAGDVLPMLHELFSRPGSFHLALYELEDEELEKLIIDNKDRVEVILANTAANKPGEWDERNAPARKRLRAVLKSRLQDRMFNNSTHIGHNKFVVHVDPMGTPQAVFTGSTNWTSTGIAGQTNNALLIEDEAVAGAFLEYWQRMHDDDKLPKPKPRLSSPMNSSQQGAAFREANESPSVVTIGNGVEIHTWFSPNRPERKKSTSKKKPAPVPPDLQEVYRRMRMAKQAVLFLAFYPGQRGVDCMIGEAVDIGRKDANLIVVGAVSSPQAMPNYIAKKTDKETDEVLVEGKSPATFEEGNVAIVRAARIDEKTLLGDLGVEQLTAKGVGAIIHDKVVVIDPLSPDCTVILGSHNLGFKASYSNDENMVIVTGHRELAMAYAVHVLDVYDHYRFRAIENERKKKGKKGWSGFLDVDDRWQDAYVEGRKGALSRYFAQG